MLRHKAFEPVMLLGRDKYNELDIRVRVKGGGHVSQAYAIRQSLAKALVAFYQKCANLLMPALLIARALKALPLWGCLVGVVPVRCLRMCTRCVYRFRQHSSAEPGRCVRCDS